MAILRAEAGVLQLEDVIALPLFVLTGVRTMNSQNAVHNAFRPSPIELLVAVEARGEQLMKDMKRLMTLELHPHTTRRMAEANAAVRKDDGDGKRLVQSPRS
jgi:hypothetical protein